MAASVCRLAVRETGGGIDRVNRPIDIPTRATADFLASHLPGGAELLEVGCGEGDVAAELARRGYRMTAIDADARPYRCALALLGRRRIPDGRAGLRLGQDLRDSCRRASARSA
jgi:SAM-dependent methyltransferase